MSQAARKRPDDIFTWKREDLVFEDFNTVNGYGRRVVNPFALVDIDILSFNAEYQRGIIPRKVRNVEKSIEASGYWLNKVVEVNQDLEIIDGQQRIMAAKNKGVKKVSISIVSFPTKQLEAAYFLLVNNYRGGVKSENEWHAHLCAKHPIAEMVYKLEDDPSSSLFNKICLEVEGKMSKKQRLSISTVLTMINSIVFGELGHWKKTRDHIWVEKFTKVGYTEIRNQMNTFLNWFVDVFGHKTEGSIFYKNDILFAIVRFYMLLCTYDYLRTVRQRNGCKKKLLDFNFASHSNLNKDLVLGYLVQDYNKNKKPENQIPASAVHSLGQRPATTSK